MHDAQFTRGHGLVYVWRSGNVLLSAAITVAVVVYFAVGCGSTQRAA